MYSKDDWMNRKWRPAMGWMYMVVCIADFIVFPILWSILQSIQGGQVTSQWNPLTLQGAGLFHLAMGAVLGVAAWSRGREKIAGATQTGYPGFAGQNTQYEQEYEYESQTPTNIKRSERKKPAQGDQPVL